MIINNKFNIGDIVYITTDVDQKPRMIYGIEVFAGGGLIYKIVNGTEISSHYDIELSDEVNVLVKMA